MAHAILSASASKRWLACPPSARLEQQFTDEKSAYAAEGTFAHSLAEHKLSCYIKPVAKSKREADYADLKKDKFYSAELEEYVDRYVDMVKEKYLEALAVDPSAELLLEERFDFSRWVPEGFGTGDAVIIASGVAEIMDLKYGKGVAVDAEGNTQMMLYALGAIDLYDCLYEIKQITMTIVQPRLDSVSSETLSVSKLLEWGHDVVKPVAKVAFEGKGIFQSGDHCQFCKARATCRERAEANQKMAAEEFQDLFLLTIDEIADLLGRVDQYVKWASDLKEYALATALKNPQAFPGWKLVEGRSNRAISDEQAAAKALLAAGYTQEQIFKLLGISKIEDLCGKKKAAQLLDGLVVKPAGKPVLAPETDKRPAISSTASAQAEFSEINESEE